MRSKHSGGDQPDANPDLQQQLRDEELLSLGKQLSTEAQQLARLYPPHVTGTDADAVKLAAARSSRHWPAQVAWLAGALVTSACLLLWVLGSSWSGSGSDVPRGAALAMPSTPAPDRSVAGPADAGADAPFTNVSFVSQLSDPELEAWLDLRHEDDTAERIAF